jgi:hypothetical protein
MFQDRSAEVFPDSLVRTPQDRSQDRNAKMLLSRSVAVLPTSSAGTFPSSNVPVYPTSSARMFPSRSAARCPGRSVSRSLGSSAKQLSQLMEESKDRAKLKNKSSTYMEPLLACRFYLIFII